MDIFKDNTTTPSSVNVFFHFFQSGLGRNLKERRYITSKLGKFPTMPCGIVENRDPEDGYIRPTR